jgi:hypothetical protein
MDGGVYRAFISKLTLALKKKLKEVENTLHTHRQRFLFTIIVIAS